MEAGKKIIKSLHHTNILYHIICELSLDVRSWGGHIKL